MRRTGESSRRLINPRHLRPAGRSAGRTSTSKRGDRDLKKSSAAEPCCARRAARRLRIDGVNDACASAQRLRRAKPGAHADPQSAWGLGMAVVRQPNYSVTVSRKGSRMLDRRARGTFVVLVTVAPTNPNSAPRSGFGCRTAPVGRAGWLEFGCRTTPAPAMWRLDRI